MFGYIHRIILFVISVLRWLWFYPRFSHLGFRSEVISPLRIDGGRNISIGRGAHIGYKSWIAALPHTGGTARLIFEDGCTIGNFNHIYATSSIILHKNVLTADKVYISDNVHGYKDICLPILQQPIVQKGEVEIGEGSWLGENVCIIGAKVGKQCVIGANSVVTKDIPDYSIAVGSPAKVIKQYNFEENAWQIIENQKYDGGGRNWWILFAA
jgi:acetyltransferase-like isoleucine patch superfamily enzyme